MTLRLFAIAFTLTMLPIAIPQILSAQNAVETTSNLYTVKSNYRKIDVFSAKNTQSHFVIGELVSGDTFNVLSIDGTWAKITFKGRDAFVRTFHIECKSQPADDSKSAPTATTTQNTSKPTETKSTQRNTSAIQVTHSATATAPEYTPEQLRKLAEDAVAMPHLTDSTRIYKYEVNSFSNISTPSEGIFSVLAYNREIGYASYFSFFTVEGDYLYAAEWESPGEKPRFDSGAAIAKTGKRNAAGKQPLYILYADGTVRELPVSITEATQFYDGIAKVEYREGNKMGVYYINTQGKKILPSLAMDYSLQNKMDMRIKDGARYLRDNRRAFYDNIKRRWGYLDQQGNIALPPKYVEVRDFANGYALVIAKGDGADYPVFIDTNGKEVVRPGINAPTLQYAQNISDISDAMFIDYSTSTYYGLDGKAVNKYNNATRFFNGYALVKNKEAERFEAVNTHFEPQRSVPLTHTRMTPLNAFDYSDAGVMTVDEEKVFTPDGRYLMNAGYGYPRNGKVGRFSTDGHAPFAATLKTGNTQRTYYGITNLDGDATVVFYSDNAGGSGNEPQDPTGPIPVDPPVTYNVKVVAVPAEAATVTGSGAYRYGDKVTVGGTISDGWLLSGIDNLSPYTLVGKGSCYEVRGNGEIQLLFVKEEVVTAGNGAFEGTLTETRLNGQLMQAPDMKVYLEMSPDNSYTSPYGSSSAGVLAVINKPAEVLKGQLRSNGVPKEGSLITFNYFPVPMKVQGITHDEDGRQWLVFDGGANIMANTTVLSTGAKSNDTNAIESLMFNLMMTFDDFSNVELTPAHYRVEMKNIDPATGAFTFGDLQRFSKYGWVPGGDKRVTQVEQGLFITKHDPGLPADYLTGVRMTPTPAGRQLLWTPPAGFYREPSTLEIITKKLGESYRNFVSQYDILKQINLPSITEAMDRLLKF